MTDSNYAFGNLLSAFKTLEQNTKTESPKKRSKKGRSTPDKGNQGAAPSDAYDSSNDNETQNERMVNNSSNNSNSSHDMNTAVSNNDSNNDDYSDETKYGMTISNDANDDTSKNGSLNANETETDILTDNDIDSDANNYSAGHAPARASATASSMAQDDNKNEAKSIEDWMKDNKLHNSELLVVLKANHVDTVDDLEQFFEESDDIASVIKSVRKRTEKILGGFSKKVVAMTGLDYEYKAPRHRAKGRNVSKDSQANKSSGYLSSGGKSARSSSPRNRSHSNSSQGSTGSVGSYTYRKHKGRPAPTGKEVEVAANAHNSYNLKQWLQSKNIFNRDLFMYLANHGYQAPDDLEVLKEKEFDRIVREVRVETFRDVDSNAKRNRVDKLLTKFEKEWRKLSGLRKTNMTKEQQEAWGYSPRTASQRALDDKEDDGFFA